MSLIQISNSSAKPPASLSLKDEVTLVNEKISLQIGKIFKHLNSKPLTQWTAFWVTYVSRLQERCKNTVSFAELAKINSTLTTLISFYKKTPFYLSEIECEGDVNFQCGFGKDFTIVGFPSRKFDTRRELVKRITSSLDKLMQKKAEFQNTCTSKISLFLDLRAYNLPWKKLELKNNRLIIDGKRALPLIENVKKAAAKFRYALTGKEIEIKYRAKDSNHSIWSTHIWTPSWKEKKDHKKIYDHLENTVLNLMTVLPFTKKKSILELFGGCGDLAYKICVLSPAISYTLVDLNKISLIKAKEQLASLPNSIILEEKDAIYGDSTSWGSPTLLIVVGGYTKQVLSSKRESLLSLKRSLELLKDGAYIVITGLASPWLQSEDFENLNLKVHNTYDASSERAFYVLQKKEREKTFFPKCTSNRLDLFAVSPSIRLAFLTAYHTTNIEILDYSFVQPTLQELNFALTRFSNLKQLWLAGADLTRLDLASLKQRKGKPLVLDLSLTLVTKEEIQKLCALNIFKDVIVDACPNLSIVEQLKIRAFFAMKANPHFPDFSFLKSSYYRLNTSHMEIFYDYLLENNLLDPVTYLKGVYLSDSIYLKIHHKLPSFGETKKAIHDLSLEMELAIKSIQSGEIRFEDLWFQDVLYRYDVQKFFFYLTKLSTNLRNILSVDLKNAVFLKEDFQKLTLFSNLKILSLQKAENLTFQQESHQTLISLQTLQALDIRGSFLDREEIIDDLLHNSTYLPRLHTFYTSFPEIVSKLRPVLTTQLDLGEH